MAGVSTLAKRRFGEPHTVIDSTFTPKISPYTVLCSCSSTIWDSTIDAIVTSPQHKPLTTGLWGLGASTTADYSVQNV